MILPFSTKFNGKETFFVEKILIGIDKHLGTYHTEQFLEDYKVKFGSKAPVNFNSKIHTIRTDEKDRWKPGILIDFFINCRQKNMFRFAPRVPVVSVQKFKLFFITDAPYCYNVPAVYVDDKFITGESLLQLAQNDGFDTIEAFFEYFNEDYVGKIIHWTDFKY